MVPVAKFINLLTLTGDIMAHHQRARTAVQQELYVSGWRLYPTLQVMLRESLPNYVQLSYHGGYPVGVIWADHRKVMVYVHPDYRRRGIATKLVKELRQQLPPEVTIFQVVDGRPESPEIWFEYGPTKESHHAL